MPQACPRLKLDIAIEDWEMTDPVRITGYVVKGLSVVVVTLSDGTHFGRGEATGVYYRHDTPTTMAAQIEAVRLGLEAGISRQDLRRLLPAGGARNAVDCALWELESARAGKPVWELAGVGLPRPLITTCTLGADSPEIMAKGAIEKYPHAKALKLKLLGDGHDAARVRAVRAARTETWIGVDANQGFTLQTLNDLLPTLVHERVSLIEQPCKVGSEAELERVRSPIPFAADESVQGLDDMAAMVGCFQYINIKLDKCGGLTEALLMVDEARRLGLRVMAGNMGGTSLAMAAALIVGQHCDVVDLDGPLFLASDRSPAVCYDQGLISSQPGVWGWPAKMGPR